MRLLHLADTHLGFRQLAGRLDPERQINQREADVYRAWQAAIDVAIDREVDVVVHAGDLFDSARPTPRAIAEALDGFARLHEAGIPAVLIAGNHSTPRTRSGGSAFEILSRYPGVHAIWAAPERIDLLGTAFHAVPHQEDAERLRETIANLDFGPGRNVLIAHGGLDTTNATYSEAGSVDLDAESIATAAVDYVALGHLHGFQVVQANAAYCGSLERLDFADSAEKVIVEVDLDAAGTDRFLTKHKANARAVFTVDVSCAGLGPAPVLDAIEADVAGRPLDGAVVRVRLDGLSRDVYQALDVKRLDALFETTLHHQLAVGAGGLRAGADEFEGGVLDLEAFARERVPDGVDADRTVALIREFMRQAGADEAEQGSAA